MFSDIVNGSGDNAGSDYHLAVPLGLDYWHRFDTQTVEKLIHALKIALTSCQMSVNGVTAGPVNYQVASSNSSRVTVYYSTANTNLAEEIISELPDELKRYAETKELTATLHADEILCVPLLNISVFLGIRIA